MEPAPEPATHTAAVMMDRSQPEDDPCQPATGTGEAFGTCGELVQGQFEAGEDFLVTLPVARWSRVRVRLWRDRQGVGCIPPEKTKTVAATLAALRSMGQPQHGIEIEVESQIPVGKGMASSSADIVAACRACAQMLGRRIAPSEISRIAIAIEPTDGVMYDGVVSYSHRRGELIEEFGALPPMLVLAVDHGGIVDTQEYNRIPKRYSSDEYEALRTAYALVRAGVREADLRQIGQGATLSARVNQRLLYKPHLKALLSLALECGGYGLCAAHSGTVLGLIFDAHARDRVRHIHAELLRRIDPTLSAMVVSGLSC